MPSVTTFPPASRRHRGVLASLLLTPTLLGGLGSFASAQTAVGASQGVNFGQAVINNSCTVSTADGAIGVKSNRTLITSDISEGGNYSGSLAAASVSAVSNLTTGAFLRVENAVLNAPSGSSADVSQVKVGTSGSWGSNGQALIGADGTLASTPVHVRFSRANNGRFTNGTYSAGATVSCYDGP